LELSAWAEKAQNELACALTEKESQAQAKAWDEALTLFRAEWENQSLHAAEQVAALRSGCEKGYASACAELPIAEKLGAVSPAEADCPCATTLSRSKKSCQTELEPWWVARVGTMDGNGPPPLVEPAPMMAIDRNANVGAIRRFLANPGSGRPAPARGADSQSSEPSLIPVLRQRDGTAAFLPPLSLSDGSPCPARLIRHHYYRAGGVLREQIVKESGTCANRQGEIERHVLDLPDQVTWGEAIGTICRAICTGPRDSEFAETGNAVPRTWSLSRTYGPTSSVRGRGQ
jgi:hypothetical protein